MNDVLGFRREERSHQWVAQSEGGFNGASMEIHDADEVRKRRPQNLTRYRRSALCLSSVPIFGVMGGATTTVGDRQVDMGSWLPIKLCAGVANTHAQPFACKISEAISARTRLFGHKGKREEMRRLDAHYSALPEEVLEEGAIRFAADPPDDATSASPG